MLAPIYITLTSQEERILELRVAAPLEQRTLLSCPYVAIECSGESYIRVMDWVADSLIAPSYLVTNKT